MVAVALVSATFVFTVGGARPAGAVAPGGSRASAYTAYRDTLRPALAVPIGWTGNTAGCAAGAPSGQAQNATLTAINYYRNLAGLTPVTFDTALSSQAQQAALMMQAQNALSHTPGPGWACYTATGAAAAGKSNLYLGLSGAVAMAGYMDDDPGTGNSSFAPHRRWILYPPQATMGSGSTSGANALYVQGAQTAPATTPAWIPWPTPGYFPFQAEPEGRWSLSASNATTDFSKALVSVTSAGVQIPVTLEPVTPGYGNPTLVWKMSPGYGLGRADRAYSVAVTNIVQNGVAVSHQYSVTLFDGAIDASQTISFPPLADRMYGDPAPTATATASSGLPVAFSTTTPAVCTASGANGATISLVGAGTCTVRADQPGDAIRTPAPPVLTSFTVAKKPLTVQAVGATRLVGAVNPPFMVTYAGFVYGQTQATSGVSGTPSCVSPATPQSPAGSYPITCAAGTLASANYSFAMVPGTLTVTHSYAPLSPARLMDTRPGRTTIDGAFAGTGAVPSGSSVNVTVTGRGGVPATGVGAVVLNVTAVGPTAPGYVTVWPAGEARPNASNLSIVAGQSVSDLVIAKVGANGQVSIYDGAGSTDVIVDVAGWFPSDP